EDDERFLSAFLGWLLPSALGDRSRHHRPEGSKGPRCHRWDEFWSRFRSDGTMGWSEFELFVRWEPKLFMNARRLFDLMDDTGSGFVTTRALLEVRRQYDRMPDYKHSSLQDLRKLLTFRFGNLARSWRTIFDPDCTGRCGRMNFAKACKEAGFNGDLKKSWLELGGGSQLRPITLRDLDREADDLLLLFSRALRENHDSVREGWFAFMK
ncbi:unnamed protein product, partial [Polarella glacialis]